MTTPLSSQISGHLSRIGLSHQPKLDIYLMVSSIRFQSAPLKAWGNGEFVQDLQPAAYGGIYVLGSRLRSWPHLAMVSVQTRFAGGMQKIHNASIDSLSFKLRYHLQLQESVRLQISPLAYALFIGLTGFRVNEVGLLPARAGVDINRLQHPRPDIYKFVRHICWSEDDVAFLCLKFTVTNGELRPASLQNENLVVGMHVPLGAFAHLLGGIEQHGDPRPEMLAVHDAVPQVGGGWPIHAAVAGPIGGGYKEVFHRFISVESRLCQWRDQ